MNSELNHFSSKSDEHMKQMPSPPFWGNFGVKEEWSPFLHSGAQSPIFGHLRDHFFHANSPPKWWIELDICFTVCLPLLDEK